MNDVFGGVAGAKAPAEGVAAYCLNVETRRDTSPHSDNSRVGGNIPHTLYTPDIFLPRSIRTSK
jgi:hypothetical protein